MSTLSDQDILAAIAAGHINIDPFNLKLLQPASYDVRLGIHILRPRMQNRPASIEEPPAQETGIIGELGLVIPPGGFFLGETMESISISNGLMFRIEGKSSIGRLGIAVHITAGFVDPGWSGPLTLEIKNQAPYPVRLHAGQLISQLSFSQLLTPASRGYSGRYAGSTGVTGARAERKDHVLRDA